MKSGTLHQISNPVTVTWNCNFSNSRWRPPPSWKSLFGHESSTDCPISAKFCTRKQNGRSTRTTWQKLLIFKIQHGGRSSFWKSLNRHISVKNRPILMKSSTLHQILNPVTGTWPKIEIFKTQDGCCTYDVNQLRTVERIPYEDTKYHHVVDTVKRGR